MKDFDIIKKLGAGSFGIVYKVRRKEDDRVYVIKSIRIAELSYQEQVDAINEVRLLSQMDCPYIVRYYDSFIEEESLHIVMEYCNSGDLQSIIKKAKDKSSASKDGVNFGLRENVTWSITLQVICGLYYLHKKKVLHRDLKTANVFLMKEDSSAVGLNSYNVKIGDLGVAKLLETSTAFAQTIVGTPYYLSPELCSDKPYRDKSDCWALGVLLYECCTLSHPFEARNQYALIMKILQAPVVPPSPQSTSPELTRLILWLLQKDPNNRPSIRELLAEIFIRRKLEKYGIPLPDSELLSDPLTNYLAVQASESRQDTPSSSRTNASTSRGGVPTYESTSVPSKSVPPRPVLDTNRPSKQMIRGDRVRGPTNQPRIISEKARSRYQIRPPAYDHKTARRLSPNTQSAFDNEFSSSESTLARAETKDNSNDTRRRSIKLDLEDVKGLDDFQDRIGVQAEMKSELNGLANDDINPNDEEEEYDEDFEFIDDDDMQQQDVDNEFITPTKSPADDKTWLEQDDRDGLYEASHSPRVEKVDDQDEDNSTISTALEIEGLQSLIREARQKSYDTLGDALFNRLYELCRRSMTGINPDGPSGEDDTMREIESALCDHLKGGIEGACEAVFSMKVLLAMENHLSKLLRP